MDMSEDCWADHVGLLQDVAGSAGEQQHVQPASTSDFLMMQHSHHHEVSVVTSLIYYFEFFFQNVD